MLKKLDQTQAQVLALTNELYQMLEDKDKQGTKLIDLQKSMIECGAKEQDC
jgi:hypothetical protein